MHGKRKKKKNQKTTDYRFDSTRTVISARTSSPKDLDIHAARPRYSSKPHRDIIISWISVTQRARIAPQRVYPFFSPPLSPPPPFCRPLPPVILAIEPKIEDSDRSFVFTVERPRVKITLV